MSKVIFLNTADYNEVYPTLGLVKKLVEYGEEVIYYTSSNFKDEVYNTGASFVSYNHFQAPPSGPPFVSQEDINQVLYSTVFYNIKVRNKLIEKIFDDIKNLNPDYIIHNHQAFWGKEIANRLNIPNICVYPGMVVNKTLFYKNPTSFINDFFGNLFTCSVKEFNRLYSTLNKAFKNIYGIDDIYDGLISDADLNIVYTLKSLQPYANLTGDNYHFVGFSHHDSIGELSGNLSSKTDNMVYISATPADKYHKSWNAKYYPILFETLKEIDKNFILNYQCADRDYYDLKDIPSNVTVDWFMGHDKIIPEADFIITNGTFLVAQEALLNGIPMIVVPVGSDHFLLAKQIEDLHLGIYIRPQNFSKESLLEAIEKIQTDITYRENCKDYANLMEQVNPDEEAAKLILDHLK